MTDFKVDPEKALPELLRLAATAVVLWFLLSQMNVAKKSDVDDLRHELQRSDYRMNLIAVTYQMREGQTLFTWTIDEDFTGPIPVEAKEDQ